MRAGVGVVSVDGEQAVDGEGLAFVGEQGAPAVAGYPRARFAHALVRVMQTDLWVIACGGARCRCVWV